jgi:hypothetical protein
MGHESMLYPADRNKYNDGSDRPFFVQAYSGGSYTSDRIGRGTHHVDNLYLNIFGGIQPEKAREIFGSGGVDDGFLDRFFLTVYPEPARDYQFVDRCPDLAVEQRYEEMCRRLHGTNWRATLMTDTHADRGRDKRPFVRFSGDAQLLFNAWYEDHLRFVRQHVDDPIAGIMNKAPGALARIVLVLHLAAWASGDEASPRQVSKQSLHRGLRLLSDYLIPMWRRLRASFGGNAEFDAARKFAKHILHKNPVAVVPSVATQLKWRGFHDPRTAPRALDILVQLDWLKPPPPRGAGQVGRSSNSYSVNPRVHNMIEGQISD